jgi:hypothetical protein
LRGARPARRADAAHSRLRAVAFAAISDGIALAQQAGKEITHMKLTILALTLVGVLVSACDDGGPAASTLGCTASNTTAAPADGVISAFSVPGSGVQSEIISSNPAAAPAFTADGTLHITVNAPVLSTEQLLLVDYPFPKCVDATAFTGVQFTISGSLSGCRFAQATQDSAHQTPSAASPYGTGAPGSHPHATLVTADQITSVPQTVKVPFAAQTGGIPATPTDKSKLTWLDWVFGIDSLVTGGPTACKADLTIADVKFY